MEGTCSSNRTAKMLPDAYGCVVTNRFGNLLDDDADPFDLISEVELEKDKKKKKKEGDEKKAKQKKPGQKESQRDRRLPMTPSVQDPAPVRKQQPARPGPGLEAGDGGEDAHRGTKRVPFGDRRNNQDYPLEFSVSQPPYNVDSDFRGRGDFGYRRGQRGGGRYPRNPDSFNLRGKREYDRHNGTGISPEEKRGGRGPWNWGSVDEAGSELMEVTPEAPVKSEEPQIPAEEENLNQAVEEDGEMMVQVAMQMSLDEWKAMQEMSRPKAEFNIRKAETTIPSKAKVIHQSKHMENPKETPEDLEDDGNFLRRSVNDITSLLDINFGSLGRPSRGGRGRGRGGQISRPERPNPIMENDPAPNPDDPEDFPALLAGI